MNHAPFTRKAILVIGMHRSGTSALTRGLEVLGVNLGSRLRSPRIENPKGFWEDLDFNAINTDVLQAIGIEWHTPDRVNPTALDSPALRPIMDRATAFLDQKFAATGLIGLKDPRASRILPFWNEVFERSGITPSYVIACRNPMSVAKSLSTRDEFPTIKGHVLWLEYMLCSLVHSTHRPRIVVDYDNMLEHPDKELGRIASAFDLAFDMNDAKFQEYNNNFLSNSLRSTSYKIEDLNICNEIPSFSKDLYSFIHNIACDRINIDDQSTHNEISNFDIIFSNNVDFLKNIINKSERLEITLRRLSTIEKINSQLNEEINIVNSKNILIQFYVRFKIILLHIKNSINFKIISNKLTRHFNSARLIIFNANFISNIKSLYHEIVALLKNKMPRNNKEKQTIPRNASK